MAASLSNVIDTSLTMHILGCHPQVWDVQELGIKAAQRILSASDPLFMLTELSQNFPSRTRSVSQSSLDASVLEELEANQQLLPGGRNLMVLNGVMMDLDATDLYQLLSRVRAEVRLADALALTGLGAEDISALMLLRSAVPAAKEGDAAVILNEAECIVWLNDIETDDVYSSWGRDISGILMRTMPGTAVAASVAQHCVSVLCRVLCRVCTSPTVCQTCTNPFWSPPRCLGNFHRIARNLYNGVLVVDPSMADGLEALATAAQVVSGRYPIRCAAKWSSQIQRSRLLQ